jgi:CIC family chloride channel protein
MPATANNIPSTLRHPGAGRFWAAVAGIGVSAGFAAALLTKLLEALQSLAWHGSGTNILRSARNAPPWQCVLVLGIAGIVTGAGQVLLRRLSSANGIDTTAAIWFHAGRMPAVRTLGSAILSILVVGLGASLGREGAPKQAGAVFANWFSDWTKLSDEQRRLLVACGAGAGMAAAYGVPLGGALFALEVLRGALALRYILPALFCSGLAAATAWTMLPDVATYHFPVSPATGPALLLCGLCGILAGLFSVVYVRLVTMAERNKPRSWFRIVAPIVGLTVLGLAATRFPELLGNGRDISQLLFLGESTLSLAGVLALLKPAAILLCVGAGVPGGLFTPSLTCGALLGTVVSYIASFAFPGAPHGLIALVGASSVLAATTQGPISTMVLLMEMTGHDRSIILPMTIGVFLATLIARSIEPRSIYDARLTDGEIAKRQELRDKVQVGPEQAEALETRTKI